jgi:hypothetical protein
MPIEKALSDQLSAISGQQFQKQRSLFLLKADS